MADLAEKWATETSLTVPRFAFERAILHLDKIEALALIRATYECSLAEAKELLTAISRYLGPK